MYLIVNAGRSGKSLMELLYCAATTRDRCILTAFFPCSVPKYDNNRESLYDDTVNIPLSNNQCILRSACSDPKYRSRYYLDNNGVEHLANNQKAPKTKTHELIMLDNNVYYWIPTSPPYDGDDFLTSHITNCDGALITMANLLTWQRPKRLFCEQNAVGVYAWMNYSANTRGRFFSFVTTDVARVPTIQFDFMPSVLISEGSYCFPYKNETGIDDFDALKILSKFDFCFVDSGDILMSMSGGMREKGISTAFYAFAKTALLNHQFFLFSPDEALANVLSDQHLLGHLTGEISPAMNKSSYVTFNNGKIDGLASIYARSRRFKSRMEYFPFCESQFVNNQLRCTVYGGRAKYIKTIDRSTLNLVSINHSVYSHLTNPSDFKKITYELTGTELEYKAF